MFGVESQPLLGVSKRIAGIGRDSVPSSLAVVESLTASWSPVVGRFDCICHQKKIVIERTRDLIYLKFVATDFSPKIISHSTGEKSSDSE